MAGEDEADLGSVLNGGGWKDKAIAALCALLLAMMGSHYIQSERSAKLEVRVATLTERSKGRLEANKELRKTQAAMVVQLASIDTSLGEINTTLVFYREGFKAQHFRMEETDRIVSDHSKQLVRLMLLVRENG